MNQISCPYTKENVYSNWDMTIFAPTKASAQSTNSFGDTLVSSTNSIPMPILLIILLFVIFVFIMSFIYIYHWNRFNMGDSFIKKAISIYLIGLILCFIPLVAFLM